MKTLSLGFIAFLTLAALPARAQDGGSQYVLAPGAGNRALGMGGAYAAISDDASAPLWNPGGLGLVSRAQFQASRTSYGLDMNEEFLGLAIPSWRWGTLAAVVRHFGTAGLDGRDEGNFATGEFSDSETQVGLSYGRQLGRAWSLGTGIRLVNQSLAGSTASGVGVDAGLIAYPGLIAGDADWAERFSMGLSFHNLVEPSLRLDEQSVPDPLSTRLGFGYRHPFGGPERLLTAAIDLEKSRQKDLDIFAGLEFKLMPSLSFRAGLRGGQPTFGTRAQWRDMAFDYVYESSNLDNVHRFGVSIMFGGTTEEARRAALRRDEEKLDARLSLAFSERQETQTRQLLENATEAYSNHRYDEAIGALAVVSVIAPDDTTVRALRMQCLLAKAKEEEGQSSFALAAVTYGQALALDPKNREAAQGSERCRSESNRLADRSTRIQELFSRGLDAFTSGDLLAARGSFAAILAEQPADGEASKMLARTDAAIERRVEELETEAQSFTRAGIYSEAESALAEATRLMPESRSVEAARVALMNARNESRKPRAVGHPSAPNAPIAAAPIRLTPQQQKDLQKFYENGSTALKAGRTEDAIRYWQWVYSVDPDYGRVREYLKREHHLLGIQAFSEGRLEEAVGFWETALKFDPQDTKTRAYLDRARLQLERSRAVAGSAGQ